MASAPTITRLCFSVPPEDVAEFAGLGTATCDTVRAKLAWMRLISAAKAKTSECARIAAETGQHFNTIYNAWKAFSTSGDWRALIDRRKTSEFWKRDPNKQIGLPREFVTWWHDQAGGNQRAFKPAHRSLILRWHAWRNGDLASAIPGYRTCPPPAPGSDVPTGWTYSNLLSYKPGAVELAAQRQGRVAALALLPGVTTTRVGTHPFAEIQFDDMWHDFEIIAPRQKTPCRLLEFGCIDHSAGYIFRPGLRPRLRSQEDGKMKHLNARDFRLYWVNWLLDFGCRPDGTVFNVENGTAAITREEEEKLLFWFDGRLTITRSGMSGAPAHAGAYHERAKGNFRVKALKEGAGRMIHNQLASLPGQVGMHRENIPAHHTGRVKETEMLLFLEQAVPALAGKLQLGFLDLREAVHAINHAYDILNARTDHAIEGWEEMGRVVDEFRASPEIGGWLPLAQVIARTDPQQRELLRIQTQLDPGLIRRRRLSPAEVLTPEIPRLIKLPDAAVPDLLGDGETLQTSGGLITFTRPEFPGKLRFLAKYQDRDGFTRRIENGTAVLTHFNPWKPDHLYLSEAGTGRYLGKAERDHSVTRADTEAIQHRHGRAMKDFKDATAELAARQGLARVPGLRANTAAIRAATKPTARETALASANLDATDLLETSDFADSSAEPAACFDPADLL